MNMNPLEMDLLDLNLRQVAFKFGFLPDDIFPFDEEAACRLLNLSEQYSFEPTDQERYKSLLIAALVWENRQQHWDGIGPFIARILIRLGLTTSAKMVNWNPGSGMFNSLGSFIDELYSTVQLLEYEVMILDQKIILSDFQKRMWDGLEQHARVGISAPTSAGKSYVLVNKAIDVLTKNEGKVFYIVPTISLITQVSNDFRKKIKELSITDIEVAQTVNDISLFKSAKIIYVLTQERAFSALNHPDADLTNVRMLIVDEIQNIEKVPNENEERAKILYDVIQVFNNDVNPEKIVISGPRLEKLESIVKDWFGEHAKSVTEDLPSVLNITYSFRKTRGKLWLIQHISKELFQSIEIPDTFKIKEKILKRQKFEEEENDLLALIINRNKKDGTIVFADVTREANKIAKGIALKLNNVSLSIDTDSFCSFVQETVHPKYTLSETLKKGIAYHHSKMPPHIKNLIEKLFINRHLTAIVATTTLMQGINLPAKNIIIKTPKVGDREVLTGYEFANLKGRAGRLMQDFVGRALIINEASCENAGIEVGTSLQKELLVGYAKKFQEEKASIQQTLSSNEVMTTDSNNDLVTYIRNMCLRYGVNSDIRLKQSGISLPAEILNSVLAQLQMLTVPRTICLNNFYWDPLVLNDLYNSFLIGDWPQIPTNIVGASDGIKECILKMAEFAPFYYNRYIPNLAITEQSISKITSLSIYAESYGRGIPLKDVIDPPNFPILESEDIEKRINDIQTKVVYGIPKLLKPLFQINDSTRNQKSTAMLSFIEVGGMDQRLRALIEIGIPRETAIALLQNDANNRLTDSDNKINEVELKRFVQRAKASNLNKWHKLIIEDI